MALIERIEKTLWEKYQYSKYVKVKAYIQQWHEEEFDYRGFSEGENFNIKMKSDGNIDLFETLANIKDDELLLKIAIDLGLQVPSVIYGIPEIKGILADRYQDASRTFDRAYEKIVTEPDVAIEMANSALESIVKKINSDLDVPTFDKNDTLYKQACNLLKYFKYFPHKDANEKIRNIGSGLLKAIQAIESIRSENTLSHGKLQEDYIINDGLYAHFVINAVSTVGLFLIHFYEKKYLPSKEVPLDDEIPF